MGATSLICSGAKVDASAPAVAYRAFRSLSPSYDPRYATFTAWPVLRLSPRLHRQFLPRRQALPTVI